ncbi:hypothetical protein B296_00045989 [Ensete ventricosum]|uniref:Retrotransposon gag domain-containing protein n=1 Tax=Ensete ventricosum TaxID=4639 RepID=A0A426XHL8_ENSVE|nr:hypothetical protein B296_00045989 [Ensete ventricosum]
MCRTFPTTLRGPARIWYSRIKPSSISSFDQFAKEFELNFIASSCPRPTVASLLGLTQGNDEPLAQFVSIFSTKIRRIPDTHPTLAIQAFLMGLRPSWFFLSLIERPPSIVPEMLQRASQYVAAESLVIEKQEQEIPRRYCRFHHDYGYDTEECNDLRNQIEDLIRQGHLHRLIRDRWASEEQSHRDRNPSPRPNRPIEKQIDVIVSGPTFGGDSSSARKAYVRSAVEKRPRRSRDQGITFGEGDDVYPDHDDALVISARIANARVKRVMVDMRSFTNILYFGAFQKLDLTDKDLLPVVTTLTGFTGDSVSPTGITALPITVGEEPRSKILLVSFIVVALPSAYNAIICRPTLNKLRAMVSTYHRVMKFPTRDRIREV